MTLLNEEQIANFPVQHFSQSSIKCYMEDRQIFFKRYIRYEFDISTGPALIEGSTVHKILEMFYSHLHDNFKAKDFDWDKAIEVSIDECLDEETLARVDWGKTGSYEASVKKINNIIGFYKDELPEVGKVLSVEERLFCMFDDLEGNTMPIPLKGFTDLIWEDENGDIVIEDHKTAARLKQEGDIDVGFEIQAAVLWFLVRDKYGKNPKKMIFRQIKKAKNRDGSPQVVPFEVEFTEGLLNRFLELYRRVVRELAGQPPVDENGIVRFLPNPFKMFGGEDSWLDFCEEVEDGCKNLNDLKPKHDERFDNVEALEI